MRIKREKIKDFDIPKKKLEEVLGNLEKEVSEVELEEVLKNIEKKVNKLEGEVGAEAKEETIYTVINKIIKGRYEKKQRYKELDSEFLADLFKEIFVEEGREYLLDFWTIPEEKKQEIINRESSISAEEFYKEIY